MPSKLELSRCHTALEYSIHSDSVQKETASNKWLTCNRTRRQSRCRRDCFRRCKQSFPRCYHWMYHCCHTTIHFLVRPAGSPLSLLTDVGLWPGSSNGQHQGPKKLTKINKMVKLVNHQQWAWNII